MEIGSLWRFFILTALGLASAVAQQSETSSEPFQPDTPGASHAAQDLRISGPNPDGWLFPITQLDKLLPHWIQFGGQFRDRVERTAESDMLP